MPFVPSEIVTNNASAVNMTGTRTDVTSISLTAGQWLLSAMATYIADPANDIDTGTLMQINISSTSGGFPGYGVGTNIISPADNPDGSSFSMTITNVIVNPVSTTTYYLPCAVSGGGTKAASGILTAIRLNNQSYTPDAPYVTSNAAGVAAGATGVPKTITSISLPAGTWFIDGFGNASGGTTGLTFDTLYKLSVVTTTNTNGSIPTTMTQQTVLATTANAIYTLSLSGIVLVLGSTTTVYLTMEVAYGGGSPTLSGTITALKIDV